MLNEEKLKVGTEHCNTHTTLTTLCIVSVGAKLVFENLYGCEQPIVMISAC